MLLNLTILASYLETLPIQKRCIRKPYVFSLREPLFYLEGDFYEPYLYIVIPARLPQNPVAHGKISLLCLGEAPPPFFDDAYEFISVNEIIPPDVVMNHVIAVFSKFQAWENRMLRGLAEGKPLHAIGEILFEIVQNPVSFCTPVLKIEMLITNDQYPLPENYGKKENSYLSYDEHEVVLTDPEYQETLTKKMPAIFSSAMYGFRKLYCNIFHQNEYLGRIVVDEIYRPAKSCDLSILLLFSEYIKKAYLDKSSAYFGRSREFNSILQKLTVENDPYLEKYDLTFQDAGWNKTDFYICACLLSQDDTNFYNKIVDDTIFLHQLFGDNYAFARDNQIIFIVHMGQTDRSAQIYKDMEYFSHKYHYRIGLSNVFTGMKKINLHYKQADAALNTGRKVQPDATVFHFETFLFDYMMLTALEIHPFEFYLSDPVSSLLAYDKQKGTELVQTLKVSLECNLSAAKAQEILHIHRTTYLYRIKRIQEISRMDLNDYRTRLYLMILFEFMKNLDPIL